MRALRLSWLAVALAACSGESLTAGFEEPLRVQGAQFLQGELPGAPPLTLDELRAGVPPAPPFPTPPEVSGRIVSPADTGFTVLGRASTDSYAVGFQIAGLGSGYWVLPVSAPDPVNAGELTWRALLDFHPALPPGLQQLRVAAFDAQGNAGTQRELELCVRSPSSDNLNACDPSLEPPALVVSLSWSNRADLDLALRAPDGSIVDRGSPRGNGPGTAGAQLERDSGLGCHAPGVQRENIVWAVRPPPGVYQIYVNLYEACGETAAPFRVTTYEAEPSEIEGELRQVETSSIAGVLLELQANGGALGGLHVTELALD